ncbi:hypothetical protein [Tropicibacter sp. S64]|uniref:hypothetical protein n=1 Tax=Tropicibacter sp. S64 TaxID=3415122 RepID=UPI003C79F604
MPGRFATPIIISLSLTAGSASAEVLSTTDPTIRNFLCVGSACADPEVPGIDDFRIKTTQIHLNFVDTSSSGYPSGDWRININDDFSGGEDNFSISDVDNAMTPFKIKGDTRDNALVVSQSGRIGFGTALPGRDLHMVSPNNPSIRLEQDASGGKPWQVWEVTADNARFQLFDYTAEKSPFVAEHGAREYALYLAANGNTGMGLYNPETALHLRRTDGTAAIKVEEASTTKAVREMFRMENNGGSYFTLANTDTGNDWYFVHENNAQGRFMVNHSDGGLQMALSRYGDLTISGKIYTVGGCSAGCDRVFDDDYPLPSIPEQAEMMRSLRHLPNVGPTPEDGPFNLTDMTGGMLNELEKAHLYIAELHDQLADQKRANADLQARVARIEALLAQ